MSSRVQIIKTNEFSKDNLITSAPKPLGKQGGRSVSMNYKSGENSTMLTIQTPWMTSYGISKWIDEKNPDAAPKLSVSLSFVRMENDPKIQEFYEFLEQLDNWTIDMAHRNSWDWLKVKNTPKETIAFNYNPTVKIPKDEKTGEPTGKPAYMKLKLILRDGVYLSSFFNKQKEFIKDSEVETVFTKGSKVRALIQCTGIWIVSGKFGLSWNLKQLIVDPPIRIGKEYAFCDDDSDEEKPISAASSSGSAAIFKEKAVELSNSEDDEPKDKPTAKIVRKVVSKK